MLVPRALTDAEYPRVHRDSSSPKRMEAEAGGGGGNSRAERSETSSTGRDLTSAKQANVIWLPSLSAHWTRLLLNVARAIRDRGNRNLLLDKQPRCRYIRRLEHSSQLSRDERTVGCVATPVALQIYSISASSQNLERESIYQPIRRINRRDSFIFMSKTLVGDELRDLKAAGEFRRIRFSL